MKNACEPFKDRRITLLGLGLLGRGVGDAEFLAGCGAQVVVTDKKSEAELTESVEKLKKYPNVTFHLGGHQKDDFTNTDLVIKAAGVPLDSPEIAAARAAGVPVAMSTALFAKYAAEAGAKIVGITGTRGKSTVTQMIFDSLKKSGKPVLLGGNVRGLSTLAMLPEVGPSDICVLELDSWQLQGFGDLEISPNVAVFTNLMPDHQNYYKDMDEYFEDKAYIFKYQCQDDTLVVGKGIEERIKAALPLVAPQVLDPIPSDWKLKIPGEHNRENAALAAAALCALGLSKEEVRAGLESFEGVEGRLQFVREVNGVKIYNDNNATTPEATIAALKALDGGKRNIVLIMGGSDKGLNMKPLLIEVEPRCKAVVLLVGTGTSRLLDPGTWNLAPKPFGPFNTLKETLDKGLERAASGDVILFSPAFASFGMFKNEYDRNDQFIALVEALSS